MPDDAFPRVDIVRLDTVITTFAPEVAVTPDQLTQGLMGRENLAAGTGMLFIFPEVADHGMWMPNMLISLDFLFADAKGNIVHLVSDVPPCEVGKPCPTIAAGVPTVKYVFEIPAGSIARHGIQLGDRLRLLLSASAVD